MSATVLYMSMSLDGFVAGPNAGPGNGLGDGGERLHEWLGIGVGDDRHAGRPAGVNGEVYGEALETGAVIAGRGTFEPAGGWGGDHHDGVPIYILTRREPESMPGQWPLVTYLDDVAAAMSRAKEAAGDRNVLVHGVGVTRLALAAGVLDEIEIHLVPVLLGEGRPLFEEIGSDGVELERTRVLAGEEGITHLHYRVRR